MTCTVIVLAKPGAGLLHARRAQLDLLRRSLDRYWPAAGVRIVDAPAGPQFDHDVREAVALAADRLCFMTDDGLLFRPVDHRPAAALDRNPEVLTFSLRYGANTVRSGPSGAPIEWPGFVWDWRRQPHDFGYPGSVDGHLFRRVDVLQVLADGGAVLQPTALECCLDVGMRRRFAGQRPLMASYSESRYVGVPVNRVSDQSGVVHGQRHPQPADYLNAFYDNGMRIDLDAIDPADVDGPHAELLFRWVDWDGVPA